jgi:hypothetical protein
MYFCWKEERDIAAVLFRLAAQSLFERKRKSRKDAQKSGLWKTSQTNASYSWSAQF